MLGQVEELQARYLTQLIYRTLQRARRKTHPVEMLVRVNKHHRIARTCTGMDKAVKLISVERAGMVRL